MLRIVSLLSLLFGFMLQLLLDGQPFSHAVAGIVCGIIALVCGLESARIDPRHRSVGQALAAFAGVLLVWCAFSLPAAYQFQQNFNVKAKPNRPAENANRPVDGASPLVIPFARRPRA